MEKRMSILSEFSVHMSICMKKLFVKVRRIYKSFHYILIENTQTLHLKFHSSRAISAWDFSVDLPLFLTLRMYLPFHMQSTCRSERANAKGEDQVSWRFSQKRKAILNSRD